MVEFVKCTRCGFRYVTDKAKENFIAEGLEGEPLLCLHCVGELTGKVINSYGYLVYPDELEASTRMTAMPKTALAGCRPCMKRRGL